MDSMWTILGLEPTRDVSAIKRSYAHKARTCHPEEDPEGFLQLREAYQAALNYAQGGAQSAPEGREPPAEPDAGEAGDGGWTISDEPAAREEGPNPYENHEAIQAFLELYTGKQRRNSGAWLDYFTSDAFLDAAWQRRFTALLLEHVKRLEARCPVDRAMLNWLCVAYQFCIKRSVYQNPDGSERTEFQVQIHTNAQFDGQESVFELATKGPAPKNPKGNELAMLQSFSEYRRLLRLAEEGVWSEQDIGQFSRIIGCYAPGCITDKCRQRGDMDCERHPAGIRLMTHFLRLDGLPEELYRIAWQKLELKTAIMGRAKLFYGPMRELIAQRFPEIAGEQKANYAKLRTDFTAYAVSTYKAGGENAQATAGDIQRTDAFFAREDFRRALLDRRMVEEELLHTWVDTSRCDYYLQQIIRFYESHESAPCARQVIDRAREMLKAQRLADRLRRDRESAASEQAVTLKSAPFFRHWLNTGFYRARDRESGRSLLDYCNQELPFLPEWSRRFLGTAEDNIVPKRLAYAAGGDTVEVRFHLRYMEFLVNQVPVYRPCLPWEQTAGREDTDAFFFLLPITVAAYDQYDQVQAELARRLEDTAAPEDARAFLAGCLADQVCVLPAPDAVREAAEMGGEEAEELKRRPLPPESVLPFEIWGEDAQRLFVCVWFQQDEMLVLFQQTPYGKQMVCGEEYNEVPDAPSAAALARQLLQEQLFPTHLPMEKLTTLPEAVYAQWDYAAVSRDRVRDPLVRSGPVKLLGEDVTAQKLEELLTHFAAGRMERLEWSWKAAVPVGEEQGCEPSRSLVFLKDKGQYACLYFDDFRAQSYALLRQPELYGKDKSRAQFVSFRQEKLFRHDVHSGFSSIRRHLAVIFAQVSRPNNVKFQAGGLWDYAVNVSHGRAKYNLDKQLLGGFPMERACSRIDEPFYFSCYPDSAACTDEQGAAEVLELDEARRLRLQQMLVRFLGGGFSKLRLSWGKEAGQRRHIVLLQDGGRFLMAWLQEKEQTAQYHVADVRTYMDVEGKKYPKDTFQGRVTPAYLIHPGAASVRNALELLLAKIDEPGLITGRFAEYAGDNPVKPRPYETLWAQLVGDSI